jgi:hypothetical protein
VSEVQQFGPHQEIISSVYEISPDALEQIAQSIEQRGIRTPVSQIVGYKADLAATRISQSLGLQTIPNTTQTNLQFDSKEFDTSLLFNATVDNTKIIARVDGIYEISAGLSWDANVAGTVRTLWVLTNGVPRAASYVPPISGVGQSVATTFRLKVGDYLQAATYQDSGGGRVLAGGSLCFLSAVLINRYA